MDLAQILITSHYIKLYTIIDILLPFTLPGLHNLCYFEKDGEATADKTAVVLLRSCSQNQHVTASFQDCTISIYASGRNSGC